MIGIESKGVGRMHVALLPLPHLIWLVTGSLISKDQMPVPRALFS